MEIAHNQIRVIHLRKLKNGAGRERTLGINQERDTKPIRRIRVGKEAEPNGSAYEEIRNRL